jgi:hypothetical protein
MLLQVLNGKKAYYHSHYIVTSIDIKHSVNFTFVVSGNFEQAFYQRYAALIFQNVGRDTSLYPSARIACSVSKEPIEIANINDCNLEATSKIGTSNAYYVLE